MKRSFQIRCALFVFLFGVFVSYYIFPLSWNTLWIFLFSLIVFLLRRNFRLFLFCVFLFGIWRFQVSLPEKTLDHIYSYNGISGIHIEGVVVEEPEHKEYSQKFVVEISKLLMSSADFEEIGGRVMLFAPRYPLYSYGDRLDIMGDLLTPTPESYRQYLSRFDVYSVMYQPNIFLLGQSQENIFYKTLYDLKTLFASRISQLFPEPHASFLGGLLIGARYGIPEDVMSAFQESGLTHIIAISGYNITLVIVFITGILKGLSRRVQIIGSVLSIFLFTLFVGASAAVVRAAIMGSLGLLALFSGRKKEVLTVLLWTAFFMTLWNPKILIFDVGFHLSFASTLGLIYLSPLLERYFVKIPDVFCLREAFLMTISAQIATLPIVFYHFQRVSLIAPFANVLVAPFVPLSMFFGFVSVFLSWIHFGVGKSLAYIAWLWLEVILDVAYFFAEF